MAVSLYNATGYNSNIGPPLVCFLVNEPINDHIIVVFTNEVPLYTDCTIIVNSVG